MERALGWLSVGLGIPPLLNPRALARLTGVDDRPGNLVLLRAVGARELAVGIGMLARPGPGWVWARVTQDTMDLPLAILSVIGKDGPPRQRAQATLATLAVISAVDVYAAVRTSRGPEGGADGATTGVVAAITINRPVAEVRHRWSEAEGRLAGTDVSDPRSVRLSPAPGGRGTEVRVSIRGGGLGALGRKVGALTGRDPRRQTEDALRRFKQRLETGQVVRTSGSPEGTSAGRQRRQRPARPAGD